MANTTENDWDENSPLITHPRRAGAVEILSLRKAVRKRISREHTTLGASGVGGEHKPGSAKVYAQSSPPTVRPDGITNLDSSDTGRLWFNTTTKKLLQWNGTSWEETVAAPAPSDLASFFGFFHKEIHSSIVPQDETGLTNGHVYFVLVYGTTINSGDLSGSYTLSATVNGVTRTIQVANHPDGTAPWMIPFIVTVSSGRIRISAISNVDKISAMTGFRIA